MTFVFIFFFFFFKFYFIFKLYSIVFVLPNIEMNPPQVYLCSPSWTLLPPTLPLGRPSAPAPSIQYRASNLDWRLVSYMYNFIFRLHNILGIGLFFSLHVQHTLWGEVIAIDWRITPWTVIVKQVSGDEESNARKAQAFGVLEGKPCCVSHLKSNLQIYWNSYFYYAALNFWIIWFSCP